MIKHFFMASLVAGILSGCAQKPSAPGPAPVVKKSNLNAQLADLLPGSDAPPPPPGQDVASAVAGLAASPASAEPTAAADAGVNLPFEGKNDAEKLTWALRAYFQDPNRPGISSLDPLVRDGIIKRVPVPPPGQKYLVDMKLCEVRLVKK